MCLIVLAATLLSREYVAAMAAAVAEHLTEQRLVPGLKSSHFAQAGCQACRMLKASATWLF